MHSRSPFQTTRASSTSVLEQVDCWRAPVQRARESSAHSSNWGARCIHASNSGFIWKQHFNCVAFEVTTQPARSLYHAYMCSPQQQSIKNVIFYRTSPLEELMLCLLLTVTTTPSLPKYSIFSERHLPRISCGDVYLLVGCISTGQSQWHFIISS